MGEVFDRCPISTLDADACEVVQIINMSEGGFGGGRLPSELLSETNYYWNVRSIILAEQARVEEYKDRKK